LTFPVIHHFTASAEYRASTEGHIDSYNMTNDVSTTSGGVIIQRRPSVIKAVPKPDKTIVDERECDTIDVVGMDEVDDGLRSDQDGSESGEEEGVKTKRKREDSVEGSRRTKIKRVEVVEKNESEEDDDWKPIGR
jgi:hypothetical protein